MKACRVQTFNPAIIELDSPTEVRLMSLVVNHFTACTLMDLDNKVTHRQAADFLTALSRLTQDEGLGECL